MKWLIISIIIISVLILSACSQSSISSELEKSVALAEELPQVNTDYFIVSDNSITYNFGSSPFYTDSLVLTEKDVGIEQKRQISFVGAVPESLLLDFPKSFAENTDQLRVELKNSGEELEWEVIEFDPVIEVINLKQKELKEPISIRTTILLLNSEDGLERIMFREARRHQLHNILANTDNSKKNEDFFLLALLQNFPEQFENPNDECKKFSNKKYETVCYAMQTADPSLCGDNEDDKETTWCKRVVLNTVFNSITHSLNEKDEESMLNFMKRFGVSDCSKLNVLKSDCEKEFSVVEEKVLPVDNKEEKQSSKKKSPDFDPEQEYDYYSMFEHPEDACEQINLGYEIKTASYVTRKLLMCEFQKNGDKYGFVRLSINPFRSGKAALTSWEKFGNPDNPTQLRKETTRPEVSDFNAHQIEETYKNVKFSASGTMNMEVSGLVDAAKDYVDSILPQYELNG